MNTRVATAGLALSGLTGSVGAPCSAVALATITLAAHQNLGLAAGTQEESGGKFAHEHLWSTKGALDESRPRVQQSRSTLY